MIDLVTQLVGRMQLARQRRGLAQTLQSLSDRQLRDIGVERNFIDEEVAAQTRSLLDVRRGAAPSVRACPDPVLQGCG